MHKLLEKTQSPSHHRVLQVNGHVSTTLAIFTSFGNMTQLVKNVKWHFLDNLAQQSSLRGLFTLWRLKWLVNEILKHSMWALAMHGFFSKSQDPTSSMTSSGNSFQAIAVEWNGLQLQPTCKS